MQRKKAMKIIIILSIHRQGAAEVEKKGTGRSRAGVTNAAKD